MRVHKTWGDDGIGAYGTFFNAFDDAVFYDEITI
jgi:hypothetical protein